MVHQSFRCVLIAMSMLGQVATQSIGDDEAKRRCDELAASPWDGLKVGKGVDVERIVVKDALPVCKAAAEHQPGEPRYQYQYGRVLSAAGQHDEAFQQYQRAAASGYVAAMTNVAVWSRHGTRCRAKRFGSPPMRFGKPPKADTLSG